MQRTQFFLEDKLQIGYEEPKQMELRTELSPFNEKEDNSSEPKMVVSMRPSIYSDIIFISVLGKDEGEPVREFKLKLTKEYLTLYDTNIELPFNIQDTILYQEDTSELLKSINEY